MRNRRDETPADESTAGVFDQRQRPPPPRTRGQRPLQFDSLKSSSHTEYDCVACGRCCYYNKPNYALLYPEDIAAFGPAMLAKYTAKSTLAGALLRAGEDGTEIFMRMENGHCCALCVNPGVSYTCSIYETRPLLCRMYEPGSTDCLEARARPTQEMPPDTDVG